MLCSSSQAHLIATTMSQNSTQKTSNVEVQWTGISASFEEAGLVTSCRLEGGCFPISHSCDASIGWQFN